MPAEMASELVGIAEEFRSDQGSDQRSSDIFAKLGPVAGPSGRMSGGALTPPAGHLRGLSSASAMPAA
jgi:hypothetical protein